MLKGLVYYHKYQRVYPFSQELNVPVRDWAKVDFTPLTRVSGEGHLLRRLRSEDAAVQDFIDHAPAFRGKINKIYAAVRNGSIADLKVGNVCISQLSQD